MIVSKNNNGQEVFDEILFNIAWRKENSFPMSIRKKPEVKKEDQ